MLLIKIAILLVLLIVFIQDLASRAVYWLLFPVLAALFVTLRFHQDHFSAIWPVVSINIAFLLLQLLIISLYFSIKQRRWTNISLQLLGWGDILFLISLTFYLSTLNYLFFYISSLILSLIIWGLWQLFSSYKNIQLPLAGMQAFLLIGFLGSDWFIAHFQATDDYWLLKHLVK